MDHSLVKIKFLSSDTEGLNYFRDSNSEHSSSFNDYNDNLNNFDHLENINILSNFNNVVHFTDFSDFETNSILNNFNNFNVSNDNFNNFEHFDNINILSNFNNIVHFMVHFIDLVDFEAINSLNNFNNPKAFNNSNNVSNFHSSSFNRIYHFYNVYNLNRTDEFLRYKIDYFNDVNISNYDYYNIFYLSYVIEYFYKSTNSVDFTNFEDIDILMKFINQNDLDNFNNISNFNDFDFSEYYDLDDIHFTNNSHNAYQIKWENRHVLNASLFHIEIYKTTSAGVHLSLFLISDNENFIFFNSMDLLNRFLILGDERLDIKLFYLKTFIKTKIRPYKCNILSQQTRVLFSFCY